MPSPSFAQNASADPAIDTVLVLLTFPHPSTAPSGWGSTLRFVLDGQDVVSRGNTYAALDGQIEMLLSGAADSEEIPFEWAVQGNLLWNRLISVNAQPTCLIEEVRAAAPSTVERASPIMTIGRVTASLERGRLEMIPAAASDQALSRQSFDPARFPGLF